MDPLTSSEKLYKFSYNNLQIFKIKRIFFFVIKTSNSYNCQTQYVFNCNNRSLILITTTLITHIPTLKSNDHENKYFARKINNSRLLLYRKNK